MRRMFVALALLACAGWLGACVAAPPLPPADDGPRIHAIRVVSNGWHTAIVAPRPEVAATGLLPEAGDFPDAAFLEFGWGDRVYYPAKRKDLGMALGAALAPSPAVMHLAGLAAAPELAYPGADVVRVALTRGELRHLVRAIAGEFERRDGGRAEPVSRGLRPDSNFYNARGTFHLFNTCNTWTARMLRAGGVDLSPTGVITADELMARLRAAIATSGLSGAYAAPRPARGTPRARHLGNLAPPSWPQNVQQAGRRPDDMDHGVEDDEQHRDRAHAEPQRRPPGSPVRKHIGRGKSRNAAWKPTSQTPRAGPQSKSPT